MFRFRLLLSLACLALWGYAVAESRRPIESVVSVEAGSGSVLDTYVNPLECRGSSWALRGAWGKALPASPERLRMEFDAGINTMFTESPSHSSSIYDLSLDFSWWLLRRWSLPWRLTLDVGGGPGIYAGVVYMPGGGNNPASAKMQLSLALKAGVWRQFRIGRTVMRIGEQFSLPSLGVFFSPQYGESYYEIWMGNHSGLARFGWWGNNFCISNLMSVDFQFGRHALRLGYSFRCHSSWVSHINTQIMSHSIVVGFIPEGFLSKNKNID